MNTTTSNTPSKLPDTAATTNDTVSTTATSLPEKTPGSPIAARDDAINDQSVPAGSESLIAPTIEPPPHKSTKVEVTQLKDPEVKDFGWNSKPHAVPSPLIKGIPNDDLFTLIRRFNKQIFHVKAIEAPDDLLDLEVSENEEFSPDKLRATLERLYMTVTWHEDRRSCGFPEAYCSTTFVERTQTYGRILFGVLHSLVVPADDALTVVDPHPANSGSSFSQTLVPARAACFGTLGSKDSLSGAPEAHRGEAVEQEARHFVSGLASVAVSTAVGKGPGDDGNGNAVGGGEAEAQGVNKPLTAVEGAVPDPTSVAVDATSAKHLASGDAAAQDPAKKSVESAMWNKARPIMRGISDATDIWERLGNALSPTAPFPKWMPRLRLAAPLVPLVLVTIFVSTAFFMRVMSFFFGFAFFGQPLLVKGAHWLTQRYRDWRKFLDLNKTLLAGVPTNAQLTLTLLRIAERNKSPLPPPPTSLEPTLSDSEDDTDSFDESEYDVDIDDEDDVSMVQQDAQGAETESKSPKRKPGRRIAAAFKRTVKASVEGALGVDHLKAKVGSENAKQRLGAVSNPPPAALVQDGTPAESATEDVARVSLPGGEGPCVFSGRMHGKRGHILLVNSATSPCVAFAYSKVARNALRSLIPSRHKDSGDVDLELKPEFTIGLHDIVELRKVGGFGWKGKIVVGWALGREVLDGLELTDRDGKQHLLTAIKGRDELFNRIIATGGQKWECW
ncbi:hypothetical protein EIP86_004918 [Pleurotus ostreatoroseus]|nr:hypothetical protein EIP86_004918 [Pleurotus ostreatoroseus]